MEDYLEQALAQASERIARAAGEPGHPALPDAGGLVRESRGLCAGGPAADRPGAAGGFSDPEDRPDRQLV